MEKNKEYLVISRTNKVSVNGPYAFLRLSSLEETVQVAVWDLKPEDAPQMGTTVSLLNFVCKDGRYSCNASDLVPGMKPPQGHPLYALIPHPESREKWDEVVGRLLSFCEDDQLKAIIETWAGNLYQEYSKWPAATAVHHAYPGGLLNHVLQMLQMLAGLYPTLPYPIKVERCILAVLFHDYGKLVEYNPQGEPQREMFLLGHIYMSACTLQSILTREKVDNEEIKLIIHCILSHHGTREFGSPVLPCTQEAFIVHYLDNLSAKTDTIEAANDMENVFTLGTHVVK